MPHKLDDEIQRLNMVAPASWVKKHRRLEECRARSTEPVGAAIRRLVEMGLETWGRRAASTVAERQSAMGLSAPIRDRDRSDRGQRRWSTIICTHGRGEFFC